MNNFVVKEDSRRSDFSNTDLSTEFMRERERERERQKITKDKNVNQKLKMGLFRAVLHNSRMDW